MLEHLIGSVQEAKLFVSLLLGVGIGAIATRWWQPSRPKLLAASDRSTSCAALCLPPLHDYWLQSVYEYADLGMNLTTPTGVYLRVNQAYCKLLGYSKAELLNGMRWQDVTHPDDLGEDLSFICKSQTTPAAAFSLEKRCIRKDGQIIWVKLHVCQVYDPQGTLQYLTTVVEDISDRKATELTLKTSEITQRKILESLPDHWVRLRRDGTYLEPIKLTGAVRVLGRDRIHVGAKIQEIMPPALAQERIAYVERALQTGELQHYEYPIEVEGELRYEEVRITPCSEDEVLLLVRDISDRKRAELALQHSEATNRAILAAMPDLILRQRCDGSHVIVGQGNCQGSVVMPLEGSEASGMGGLPPELAARRLQAIEDALATQQLQVYEQRLQVNGIWYDEEVRVVAIPPDEVLVLVRNISDRKRAEAALLKQAAQERALTQLTRALHRSLEPEIIFSTAVREFARCLNAAPVLLWEYLPEQSCWRMVACCTPGVGSSGLLGGEMPDLPQHPIFTPLKQFDSRCWTLEEPPPATDWPLTEQFPGAWLLLPVGLQTVWGCLGLVKLEQPWQADEMELAQAITQQLAIAIQQATLYRQVQRLNMHLENQVEERTDLIRRALNFEALLKRITDKVRDSLDENQILQTAIEELGQGLNVICCNAALYSEDGLSLHITYEYFTQHPFAIGKNNTFADWPDPAIFTQLYEGQYTQFCCPGEIIDHRLESYHAVLACPLVDDQRVLGDLWLFKEKHDTFTDLEVRLVQQVANQCAIALRQSRLYQAAQAQVHALERLNQLKDDFLSTVTHELRTPMANIKMATQMLEINLHHWGPFATGHDLGDPSRHGKAASSDHGEAERIHLYLQILRDECKRETDLINNLLDLSRLDAGSEPLVVQTLELQYWLPHLSETFIERIRQQQQQFSLEIGDRLPPLTTDFNYLELILSELLHNACKYTPAGETIKVFAIAGPPPTPEHPADRVQIGVANSGVTIPPTELGHLFDKFYRVPNNDPWKHGGTGLGLALVKKRVERLQGAIAVTHPHPWLTFTLQLPLILAGTYPQPRSPLPPSSIY